MNGWFNARKAAQVVAFFALKQAGTINVLKLAKLVYLADRLFMQKYDATMLNDSLVSMPHGPVNSMTLNHINGLIESDEWAIIIAGRAGYAVGVTNPKMTIDDLDELSRAEVATLEETWKKFGSMSPFQVRDYTHQHCPEWEDPHGSSEPIPYARVFKFLGKTEVAEELEDAVLAERTVAQHCA